MTVETRMFWVHDETVVLCHTDWRQSVSYWVTFGIKSTQACVGKS